MMAGFLRLLGKHQSEPRGFLRNNPEVIFCDDVIISLARQLEVPYVVSEINDYGTMIWEDVPGDCGFVSDFENFIV